MTTLIVLHDAWLLWIEAPLVLVLVFYLIPLMVHLSLHPDESQVHPPEEDRK